MGTNYQACSLLQESIVIFIPIPSKKVSELSTNECIHNYFHWTCTKPSTHPCCTRTQVNTLVPVLVPKYPFSTRTQVLTVVPIWYRKLVPVLIPKLGTRTHTWILILVLVPGYQTWYPYSYTHFWYPTTTLLCSLLINEWGYKANCYMQDQHL